MMNLDAFYEKVPNTTCTKTSCASWCCTKLASSEGDAQRFMPLPLIYSVEYLHIKNFLDEYISDWEHQFDFYRMSRVCPFKDPHSPRCRIYPVRPFSCRVYGRKVPPVLWGVKVSPEQISQIECPDVREDEPQKLGSFHAEFESLWWILTKASLETPLFEKDVQPVIAEVTGMPQILILAFGEFLFLQKKDRTWFESHFKEYWETMGNLL